MKCKCLQCFNILILLCFCLLCPSRGTALHPWRLRETSLESTRLSPIYRARLEAGYSYFMQWLSRRNQLHTAWSQDVGLANQLLAECLDDAYLNKHLKFETTVPHRSL